MNVLLVNGSPRRAGANSRIVLDGLRKRLGESHRYRMVETMASSAVVDDDLDTDLMVVAFPLYIDCLHSTLIEWLQSFEELKKRAPGRDRARRIAMIAVANNGFHEGVQNAAALDILSNFCARAGIEWLGGAGIGTGEMMANVRNAPDDMFIKRPISQALDAMAALAATAGARADMDDDDGRPAGAELGQGAGSDQSAAPARIYASHAFPWIVYKAMGHMGWRRHAKANGITRRAMLARPLDRA